MNTLILLILFALAAYYMYGSYQSVMAAFNGHIKKVIRIAAGLRAASAVLVVLSVVTVLIVHIWDEVITYSYEKGIINEHSSYSRFEKPLVITFGLAALLLLISIPIECSLYKKGKNIARSVIVTLIMVAAVLVIGLFVVIRNYDGTRFSSEYSPKFYKYSSPVNDRTIVICEKSHNGSGYGEIFQVKGSKAEKIGSFTTANEYRSEGAYKFEWTAAQVTVTYGTGKGSDSKSKVTAKFVDMQE